jgi:uncharacterized membrane protein
VTTTTPRVSDHVVEQVIGRMLQLGVLLAAVVVLVGAVALLWHHGSDRVSYVAFSGEPVRLRSVAGIVGSAMAMRSDAIVQLGLLLLIATPIARVALTLVAFVIQRDRTYVVITLIVLALLLYGLFFGHA